MKKYEGKIKKREAEVGHILLFKARLIDKLWHNFYLLKSYFLSSCLAKYSSFKKLIFKSKSSIYKLNWE
jgi:hypothetical protein